MPHRVFQRSLSAMTLWQLPVDKKAKIKGYNTSLADDQQTRLQDLGFAVGEFVLCLRKMPFGGPSLFQVQNTVYGLEKELAMNVFLDEFHE